MKVLRSFQDDELSEHPYILTIGNFDGVHKGHQVVLDRVKELSKVHHAKSSLITFQNHPSEVLSPTKAVSQVCSLEHKLKMLEDASIDTLFLLPFTKKLSEQTAEQFIRGIREHFPFIYLVLGHDATLGKDRQGDQKKIESLAKSLGFQVEYLDAFSLQDVCISSSKIREFIKTGNFEQLSILLGRKYSIYSHIIKGEGKGKTIGFPTANIDVKGLCLPPLGVYAVKLIVEDKETFAGVANLGVAPTVRNDNSPLLEVHLFDQDKDLYGKPIEVIFLDYIRPEKKFASLDELKNQIQQDIMMAKELVNQK